MNDFAAIDFETANGCRSSVCSVGVVVRGGNVTDTFYSLIHCTCRASRRHFGRSLPNHQLPTLAEACGYCLENHHHALADAEACAAMALKIL